MATWENEEFCENRNNADIDSDLDNIFVTHDLQDCLDDGLDLPSFVQIYEESHNFDYDAFYADNELHDDSKG